MTFAAALMGHLGLSAEGPRGDADAVEARLSELLEGAHAAWPALHVPDDEFLRYLATRLSTEEDPLVGLAELAVGDLYLACGCVRGDAAALSYFEQSLIARVPAYLSRQDPRQTLADDVKQMLRTRLLMGRDGQAPRISAYMGRGPLGAWLRVSAVRAAVDLRRISAQGFHGAEAPPIQPRMGNPEIDRLRSQYADEFRDAFHKTLAGLDARDGNVLRLYFLDGMPPGAVAKMYRVSIRTVHRWVADARKKILDETFRLLRERLKLSATEIEGMFAVVESQVNVSILRFLPRDEA